MTCYCYFFLWLLSVIVTNSSHTLSSGGWLPQQPPKDYRNRPPAPTPAPIPGPIPGPTPPSRSIQNNLQASILEGQQKLRKTPVEPPTPVAKPSPLPAPATKPKNLTPPNKPIPAAKPVVPEKPARTVARLRDNISEKNQNATPLNFRNGPEKPKLLVTSNADQSASGEVSQGKPSSSRPMKKLPPTPGPGKLQGVDTYHVNLDTSQYMMIIVVVSLFRIITIFRVYILHLILIGIILLFI